VGPAAGVKTASRCVAGVQEWWLSQVVTTAIRPLALGWALVLPLGVAGALMLVRDVLAGASMALILVLVVVAVAIRGDRAAGMTAAVVAAAAFDFLLTEPYLSFSIRSAADIEAAVLLLLVGIAVTEVAQWARRELDRAARREAYLAGVAEAARFASGSRSGSEIVDVVGRMIAEVLDLDGCRFSDALPDPDRPRLCDDGTVTRHGRMVDVERDGLPTMDVVELPVRDGAGVFLLTASTRVRRPGLEQRQVAVTLASQVRAGDGRPLG
jgi:hypothetical protein